MPTITPPIPANYQTLPTWAPGHVPSAIAYYDGSSGGPATFLCLYKTPVAVSGMVMPSDDRVNTCSGPQPQGECFWYISPATTNETSRWAAIVVGTDPSTHIVERPVVPYVPDYALADQTPRAKSLTDLLVGGGGASGEHCPAGYQWNGAKCMKIASPPHGFPSSSSPGGLNGTTYTVGEDDQLSSVAALHGVSVYEVLVANRGLRRTRTLSGAPCFHEDVWTVGRKITIPPRSLGAVPHRVPYGAEIPGTNGAKCYANAIYDKANGWCIVPGAGVGHPPYCSHPLTLWNHATKTCEITAAAGNGGNGGNQAPTTDTTTTASKSSAGPILAGLAIAAVSGALVYGALHAK